MSKHVVRFISVLLVGVMLASLLLSGVYVFAEELNSGNQGNVEQGNTGSSNQMVTSMINFFRDARTNLAVDNASRDEVIIYGIFLSNFFVPWSTKISDLTDDSSDNSLPKRLSRQFFGTTEKATDFVNLNKKLQDAILEKLTNSSNDFNLYARKPNESGLDKSMSGEDLYNKIAGKDGDSLIYNSSGKAVINVKNRDFQAAMQVLLAFSPEMMLSKDKGLRKIDRLYMDGLGNIWGAYGSVDASGYVLVLPACLNPIVFSNDINKVRFPIANVFSMGAMLKFDQAFLNPDRVNESFLLPYYNLKKYLTRNSGDKSRDDFLNNIHIFGVHTPTKNIGNSDAILGGSTEHNVKEFADLNVDSPISSSNLRVFVSFNTDHLKDLEGFIKSGNDLNNNQRKVLSEYFFKTVAFNPDEVMDTTYYLNGVNINVGDKSLNDNDALAAKESLLFRYAENGGRKFHSSSYASSPFMSFYSQYLKAGDKEKFLSDNLKGYSKASVRDKNALKNALNNGVFENVPFARLLYRNESNGSNLLANLIPKVEDYEKLRVSNWMFWENIKTSFALTTNDSKILDMTSSFFKDTGWRSNPKISAAYFYNFMAYNIFSMNSTLAKGISGKPVGTEFNSPFGKFKSGLAIMDQVNIFSGIYWGYMVEILDPYLSNEEWRNKSFSHSLLPQMNIAVSGGSLNLNDVLNSSGVVASKDKTLKEMQEDIIKKVYGLLTEGPSAYRDKLVKSVQDSWVLSTHRAITGSWIGDILSVSSGGNSSYASVVGYINTPSLSELPLTSWFVKDYLFIYMLMLLVVLFVVVMLVITNNRTVREGVAIFFIMAFVLVLPQFLVGKVIDISNSIGDRIYSERFNFWALTQHEQSVRNLKGARVSGNELDYIIARNVEDAKNIYSSDVGVRVKWMSPKKNDVFESLFSGKKNASQKLMENATIFRWLFSSVFYQEEYVYNDPLATYLYRPYNAIANEAKASYEALEKNIVKREDVADLIQSNNKAVGVPDYRFKFLFEKGINVIFTPDRKELIDQTKPYGLGESDRLNSYRFWMMNNEALVKSIFRNDFDSFENAGFSGDETNPYYYSFSLLTESPFYYFYNVFKHRYGALNGGFKHALLNQEVFKVVSNSDKVDKRLRDFMDLEGLFTYVVPFLQQGNEYVYEWTSRYGRSIEGYDFKNGESNIVREDFQERFDWEKSRKDALMRVWKLYSPWVDQISNLGVHGQKAYVANKRVTIQDALNPGAYDDVGRPMIFSEADMYAKGYRMSDLSDIELRIQATLQSTYRDLMYLVNYFDFDDEVLITAGAMLATFNFNREFSDNRFLGESIILYPQNFELKNFNYDAFMRLILLNSTGEKLEDDKDLYVRILEKTSIFTGILLLICDLMAVVVIPTMKIAALLLLLFLGLLIVLSFVLTPPENMANTIFKKLVIPAGILLIANTLFAFVVALFMGEGLTGYVGGRLPSLGMTDPTVTMLGLIFVDCVYAYVLWKVISLLYKSFKGYLGTTFFGVLGTIAGAYTTLKSSIKERLKPYIDKGTSVVNKYVENVRTVIASREEKPSFVGNEDVGDKGGSDISENRKLKFRDIEDIRPDKDDSLINEIDQLASNGKSRVVGKVSEPVREHVKGVHAVQNMEIKKVKLNRDYKDRSKDLKRLVKGSSGSIKAKKDKFKGLKN